MAGSTGIQWTDASWNPVVGCSVVSPGCTNCYAQRMAARVAAMTDARRHAASGGEVKQGRSVYAGLTRPSKAGPVWTGEVRLAEDALLAPLRWRKPRRVFVNSMGDLFHEKVPDEWIDRVFAVMALATQHTFQVLTKRAERMRDYLTQASWQRVAVASIDIASNDRKLRFGSPVGTDGWWPLPNVWLGVSAEDQRRADERILALLASPAAVRFVSVEPMLGSVDLTAIQDGPLPTRVDALTGAAFDARGERYPADPWPGIDWVICGGESGPGARVFAAEWAESLRDQCAGAVVPFFMKQVGGFRPRDVDIPAALMVRQFPDAGRS